VGKSTLFNRLTKSRNALVEDQPGVTRDRHYAEASWEGHRFTLIDTGGFVSDDLDDFAAAIRMQIDAAIADADLIVLVLDGRSGLTPFDRDMVDRVRQTAKPVFVVVNKIDGADQTSRLHDFYELGIGTLYPLSAEHRYGLDTFLDALVAAFPQPDDPGDTEQSTPMVRLAVVGRPNVGKSSLINRLIGRERMLVSDVPGTTRDAIDTLLHRDNHGYLLVDTAGIRRKGKVHQRIEKFSVIKALHSLERCDLALVLIDAGEGVTDQDINVAGYAHQRGRGCILLINKWDLMDKDPTAAKRYIERLRYEAKFLQFAPVLTISAKTGLRVHKILPMVDTLYGQYKTRIATGQLNRIMAGAVKKNEPAMVRGRRIKIFYATQITTGPPTFIAFVNYPDAVHFSYQRYLINAIRNQTGLTQTPIRLYFRQRKKR
jgi:GTP-binding protein